MGLNEGVFMCFHLFEWTSGILHGAYVIRESRLYTNKAGYAVCLVYPVIRQ
jgi:hypothetical protein